MAGWQSTGLTTLRALVMIVCLAALPMYALFGDSLPSRIQAFLKPQESSPDEAPLEPGDARFETGRSEGAFAQGRASDSRNGSPLAMNEPDARAPDRFPLDSVPTPSANAGQVHGGMVSPLPFEAAAAPDRYTADPNRYASPPPGMNLEDPPVELGVARGFPPREPFTRDSAPREPTTAAEEFPPLRGNEANWDPNVRPAAAVEVETQDRPPLNFEAVQGRLQELGASYYRLETWGRRDLFRFHCRMQLHEDARSARHFESVAPDPLAAMLEVLRQVEAWRWPPETR